MLLIVYSLDEGLFVEEGESDKPSAERDQEEGHGWFLHRVDNLEVYLDKITDLTITGNGKSIP